MYKSKKTCNKLKQTSWLTRKIGILRCLGKSTSVKDLFNKIICTIHKYINKIKKVDDKWIGTSLLAGFPYNYSTMTLESSGIGINAVSIKGKLFQDIRNNTKRVDGLYVTLYSRSEIRWLK